ADDQKARDAPNPIHFTILKPAESAANLPGKLGFVYSTGASYGRVDVVQKHVNHDSSDRNIKPNRQSPARDLHVPRPAIAQSLVGDKNRKRRKKGGQDRMRQKYPKKDEPNPALAGEARGPAVEDCEVVVQVTPEKDD